MRASQTLVSKTFGSQKLVSGNPREPPLTARGMYMLIRYPAPMLAVHPGLFPSAFDILPNTDPDRPC